MRHFLGFKKEMTQVYIDGKARPATIVSVPENYIALVEGKKGTCRVATGEKKSSNQAQKGIYADVSKVPSYVWSVKCEEGVNVGDKFTVENLEVGSLLKITGTTKGKGFMGVMKRWGFKGGQRTHGQSDRMRAPGSIGAGTDPGRVFKGKRMGGRMGGDVKTITGRTILDKGEDYIIVAGPLPGNRGSLLKIELINKDEK